MKINNVSVLFNVVMNISKKKRLKSKNFDGKKFWQPIKNILNVIGWKTEKQGSLEDFFGPIN